MNNEALRVLGKLRMEFLAARVKAALDERARLNPDREEFKQTRDDFQDWLVEAHCCLEEAGELQRS